MKKIKILFCEIYDDGTVGGSHSILFNLVTSLDKSIFLPTVSFLAENIYCEKLREIGIEVKLMQQFEPSRFGLSLVRKTLNYFNLIIKKTNYLVNFFRDYEFDLVVINNTLFTAEPYIRAAKRLGIPIIIYERGLNIYSKREIALSQYVSVSIPMSDAIYDSLVSQGVRAKKIVRIYDGVDKKKILPTRTTQDVKSEFNLPETCKLVGIVGNVKPWKGQKYFIQAFAELSERYDNLYGIVVGAWTERDKEYKIELDNIIIKNNLQDKVIFTGYRTDVPDLLGALDVFVHASTRPEPFGMVVPEAMAAKVPVIATNFGGPVESLDGGKCGILVPPQNGHAIAVGIEQYLINERLRLDFVRLAYGRYLELFELKNNVKLAEKIFLNLL